MPFFLVHGAEAVLPVEITHEAPRIATYVIRINVIRRGFGPIFHGDQTNSKIAKENSI
jgi:hypothetical protein